MRAADRFFRPAILVVALALTGAPSVHAAPAVAIEELGARLRGVLPVPLFGVPLAPQAVAQTGPDGRTINPADLDSPATLERDLRAALGRPRSATRLNVTGGIARLGRYSIGSEEVHRGHVVVLEGNADIHGRLEGNLVTLDGDILVHPGAVITGDVLAIGGQVRALGGLVEGATQEMDATPLSAEATTPLGTLVATRAVGFLGVMFTLLVVGFGLVTFGRPNLEIVSDTVTTSFGRSFLVGVLGQVLLLPTFGALVVGLVLTVAGALLVPFAVVVFALLAIVAALGGAIAVAHAMGETITRRRMAHGVMLSPNAYRYVTTGLAGVGSVWLAWIAFGWVPFAGGVAFGIAALASWVAVSAGFGAALLSRGGIREEFSGRMLPTPMMTDEYLWATPQFGVPAVKRPPKSDPSSDA
jgi:hypothetical protein